MQIKKNTLLWVAIAVLFIAVLFVTFKAGTGGGIVSTTAQAVSTAKGAAANTMVGGC